MRTYLADLRDSRLSNPLEPLTIDEALPVVDEKGLWGEIEARNETSNIHFRTSPALLSVCRAIVWAENRSVSMTWFYGVWVIMWVAIPFDLLVVPDALVTIFLGHGCLMTIALLLVMRAWKRYSADIWQGLSTCFFVSSVMLAAVMTGLHAGGLEYERFVTVGFFGMATALVLLPLTTGWAIAATLLLDAILLICNLLNPGMGIGSTVLFTLYCWTIANSLVGWRFITNGRQVRIVLARLLDARNKALLKESHDRLHILAHFDALTGLRNRKAITDDFDRLLREMPPGTPLSVAMIDIDDFKRLNDSLGHAAGDEALRAVGTLFQSLARTDRAICGRIGGEEFLVLMPGATADAARQGLASLAEGLARLNLPNPGSRVADCVTLSMGLVTTVITGEHACGAEALMHDADIALYEAKNGGRDRIVSKTVPPLPIAA